MSEETTSIEGQEGPGVPAVAPDEAAMWEEEVEKLRQGEPDFKSAEKNETPDETPEEGESEAEETTEEEVSAPAEETQIDPKVASLEEKIAQLEALLLSQVKEKPKAEEAVEAPKDEDELSAEEKEVLEFTPGLAKIIDTRAKKIAQSILADIEKQKRAEVSKEADAQQDAQFWGELRTWVKSENPDLDLDEVRSSADFNDWLDMRKTWVNTTLASAKSKSDTSGAKSVFQRYLREAYPATAQRTGRSLGDGKRAAAARTPASLTSRSPREPSSEGDLWENEVQKLVAKEAKLRRGYI